MITVVLPTVPGRDVDLRLAFGSVAHEADRVLVLKGHPTCGSAWNEGLRLALELRSDYVLLFADDLIAHEGWSQALPTELAMPAPILRGLDGHRQHAEDGEPGDRTTFSRVPFLTLHQATRCYPFPEDMHYYTDCLVANWLQPTPVIVDERFRFTHTWSMVGRLDGAERDAADRQAYVNYLR